MKKEMRGLLATIDYRRQCPVASTNIDCPDVGRKATLLFYGTVL